MLYLMCELWLYVLARKQYWLVPLIVSILLCAALVLMSHSSLAPFIYTLF